MQTQNQSKSRINLSLILCGVVILWILSSLLLAVVIGKFNSIHFGDAFAGVSALFSALAFAGIIITIYMQKEELELQRDELKLTREELAKSAKAQEDSRHELERQANNLKQSARLSALSTLVNYHTESNKNNIGFMPDFPTRKKLEELITEIEAILEDKR